MFIVVFLLSLSFPATRGRKEPILLRVDEEYTHDAPASSWITINLAHPTSSIKSVMWCKSISPNIKHPPPIQDCKGAGLTHLELYPERVRILPEEPNTVYVDPEQIGGWDTEHQFDIIVKANVKEREDAELMQVVRFNAPLNLPPPPAGAAAQGGAGGTETSAIPSPPLVENVEGVNNNGLHGSKPSDHNGPVHPWTATFIVFGLGMFVFVVLGGMMALKKRKYFAAAARPYGAGGAYAFDKLSPTQVSDSEDELQSVEMQDMSILMKLGKGANEAFKMNV